jgi:predicted lipoprotein with Yx(FWY)xxD motif
MPWSAPPPAKIDDGVLTDTTRGMTLYTFDHDIADSGNSACNGPCAKNWPPFYADADAKPHDAWTLINRDDGKSQWAYKGKPLYFWSKDVSAGDRKGDGFKNMWRAATP